MMCRIALACAVLLAAAPAGFGDVVIVKDRRGNDQVEGIRSEIDGRQVTPENVEAFLDKSSGVVVLDGYAVVKMLPRPKAPKPRAFPRAIVVKVLYSTEPEDLLAGYDSESARQFSQALASFRAVLDSDARDVFKAQAYYEIGRIYIRTQRLKSAIEHFKKWSWPEDVHTPQIHDHLARLYANYRHYDDARAEFKKIEALPDIPMNWVYKARLGRVWIDISERKWAQAEKAAATIAGQCGNDPALASQAVLAAALQARAILGSGDQKRLAEAERILRRAEQIKGADHEAQATLYLTLGDVLYMQRKPAEARFPYMRVVCLFPDQRAQVADALLNAGQAFLDLAGLAQQKGDKDRSDTLFVKGMKLLGECAGRYRSFPAAGKAAKTYLANKQRYTELKAQKEEEQNPSEPSATGTGK